MQDPMNNHPEEITFHVYLDNELSHFERENFESHLSGCQKCQFTLFELEEIFTKIEGIFPVEYGSDISPFVVGEIEHIVRSQSLDLVITAKAKERVRAIRANDFVVAIEVAATTGRQTDDGDQQVAGIAAFGLPIANAVA